MKYKLLKCYSASIALAGLMLGTTAGFAATPTSITVQTAAQVAALNGTGATYGPPSNATFPDGAFTVGSGTSATLSAGPAGQGWAVRKGETIPITLADGRVQKVRNLTLVRTQ